MNSSNLILIFSIIFLTVKLSSQAELTKIDAMKMLLTAAIECKISTKASDEDMLRLQKQEVTTPEGKCLGACIMKTMGVLTPEGKLIKDGVMKGIKIMFDNDPEKQKIAEEIVDICADITDPEICEAAFKIGSCMKKEKIARGLTLEM